MKQSEEFNRFDDTMRKLISITHGEIKAKLDAEKGTKARKKRKAKPSASDRASGKTD